MSDSEHEARGVGRIMCQCGRTADMHADLSDRKKIAWGGGLQECYGFVRLERVGLVRCGFCAERGQCTKAHAHQGEHTFALGMEEECEDCLKGLSRHARGGHPFNWQGRLTTESYAAACGCGPNEACSRCSTPRPVSAVLPHKRRPDVVNCQCLGAFGMLNPGEQAPCGNCGRGLVHPEDEKKRETPCAHQWMPHARGAWCPNCDVVKSPPSVP